MAKATSLRWALPVYFVLAAALPVLVLGGVFHFHLAPLISQDIEARSGLLAQAVAGEISTALEAPEVALRYIALEFDGTSEAAQRSGFLQRAVNELTLFESVFVLDADGVVKNAGIRGIPDRARQEYIGIDMSGQEFFRKALLSDEPVWSDAARSIVSGETTVTISLPSERQVISGSFGFDRLDAVLRQAEAVSNNFDVFVTDRRGVVIRGPADKAELLGLNVSNWPPINLGLRGESGTLHFTALGSRRLGSVHPIGPTGWILLLAQSEDRAFAPLNRLELIFALSMLVAGVGAGVGAVLIARRVTGPVSALAEEARRISQGDYGITLSPGGYSEFRGLAQDFTAMVEEVRNRENRLSELGQRLRRSVGSLQAEVAERERAEATLRERENTVRSLLMSTGEGIYGMDMEGRCTFCNTALVRILGFNDASELLGRNMHSIIHHSHANGTSYPEHDCRIIRALNADQPVHVDDEVFWRADGTAIPVEYRARPVRQDGRLVGAVVTFSDITERKDAQRRLRDTVDHLTRANTELERFTYLASHDLQEPVRSVVSYAELLDRSLGEDLSLDARQYMRFIVEGANRMGALVRDLLAYTRIGGKVAAFVDTDLADVVGAAIESLHESIEEESAEIHVGELPKLPIDPIQMLQVFQHLIGNAIKFRSVEKNPEIWIQSEREGDDWKISVKDNGIGIDPAYVEQIFVIFKRLHTQDAYPGTGVGLAVCRRVIERHGGRISVDSKLGEGATFVFTLPAERQSTPG